MYFGLSVLYQGTLFVIRGSGSTTDNVYSISDDLIGPWKKVGSTGRMPADERRVFPVPIVKKSNLCNSNL